MLQAFPREMTDLTTMISRPPVASDLMAVPHRSHSYDNVHYASYHLTLRDWLTLVVMASQRLEMPRPPAVR